VIRSDQSIAGFDPLLRSAQSQFRGEGERSSPCYRWGKGAGRRAGRRLNVAVRPMKRAVKNPRLWHFRVGGPDMERLVAGRERIYLDRFWNEFSATPKRFNEASRRHYAKLYARPGAMHAGFAQFAAFDQDAVDNRAFVAAGKLDVPVLALGGEKSFGTTMAAVMRFAASDVEEGVVPDSGHWIMEENSQYSVDLQLL
jgi:pimeloyl-ACP methyl ester carboxylesterase